MFGKSHSEETRIKISNGLKGHLTAEETKAKISFANSGSKNGIWLGGIAHKPYAPGNTKELKEKIRTRDNHTCQECGRIWNGKEKKFSPHHIDYDKKHHAMWNRITLCNSCHSKTVVNRNYWISHFYAINFSRCVEKIYST